MAIALVIRRSASDHLGRRPARRLLSRLRCGGNRDADEEETDDTHASPAQFLEVEVDDWVLLPALEVEVPPLRLVDGEPLAPPSPCAGGRGASAARRAAGVVGVGAVATSRRRRSASRPALPVSTIVERQVDRAAAVVARALARDRRRIPAASAALRPRTSSSPTTADTRRGSAGHSPGSPAHGGRARALRRRAAAGTPAPTCTPACSGNCWRSHSGCRA